MVDNDKAEIEQIRQQIEKLFEEFAQDLGAAVGEFDDIPMDAPSSEWRKALKRFAKRVSSIKKKMGRSRGK